MELRATETATSFAEQAKPVAWVTMLFYLGNGSISSLGEIGKHDRLKICSLWVTGSSPVVSRRSKGPEGGGASLAEPIFALTTGTARPLVIYKCRSLILWPSAYSRRPS